MLYSRVFDDFPCVNVTRKKPNCNAPEWLEDRWAGGLGAIPGAHPAKKGGAGKAFWAMVDLRVNGL
ncbi:hypothetical protein LBMAG55_17200 [Verrucomicrobiota bacterium]|nr:hypothetical protein LBMAG55_17200 [Verrucomicrobiota bacterium]